MEPLDEIDQRILDIVQRDGRMTSADIGRRVNLSQPAASARLQRLERSGVITGYRAVIDPAKVGLSIHAVVRLRTTHAHLAATLEVVDTLPEVLSVYRVTGEDCFLLDIYARDAKRLEHVVDAVARFGPVTTSLVLNEYAVKPMTPVAEDSPRGQA